LYGTLQGHQDGGACLLYRQAENFPGKSIPPSAFWESAEKSERTEAVLATLNREELPVVQVYKCPICGKDYLCRDHFDKELRCCEECAETKREAAAQEAEAKRKAKEERKAVVKRKKEQEQREEAKREEEQRQAAQKRLERGLVPMTYVEGGSFQMGSDYVVATSDEQPVHKVLVDGFYLGKYPVTQEQYQKVTGKNPSDFDSARYSSNWPVAHVSWYDAVVFCNRLSIQEGRKPAYELGGSSDPDRWGTAPNDDSPRWDSVKVNWEANGYRLPTEAEWEFAARGGVKSRGYRYAGSNYPNEVAWYCDNAVHGRGAVGEKRPNELGLYDMSGNVYEWCWDWYDGDYYKQSPAANPRGPVSGSNRVCRGGCWGSFTQHVRTANRSINTPTFCISRSIGFRVLAPAV
jgi:formylglycine-generating enzyme